MNVSGILMLLSGVLAGGADYVIGRDAPGPDALAQWLQSVLGDEMIRLRPVQKWRTPVRVAIDFHVQSVLDMDEKQEQLLIYILYRQVWQDKRLSWDPFLHRGVLRVTVPEEKIWVPDVVLYEMAGNEESPQSSQVSVSHLGWVEQWKPRLLKSRCPLNLYHFPVDHHTCNMTFGAMAHTIEEVEVHWGSQSAGGSREWDWSFSTGEWEVVSLVVPQSHKQFWHFNTSAVRIQVTVRRHPLLYLVTLLLPSSLLLVLDILAFFIPPYLKQRLNIKTTIFTGQFIFIITIFTFFPPCAKDLPLIEVYLFYSLGLLACSAMETAVVFQVANGRNRWFSKNLFPCLSLLLGRSRWEEPRNPEVAEDGSGWDTTSPDGEQGALRTLQQDLSQVRKDLQLIRQEQDRLTLSRELGSALDYAYLYLHCLLLLTGGVVMHTQWLWGPPT